MIPAVSRHSWAILCAIVLSFGPLESPAQAWWYSSYGYGAYYAPYAPATYTAGYRYTAGYGYGGGCGYGGCCLTSLFHGCGLFGCYRPTYSSCYAPACCPSPCGSCGDGSCGYGSCGYACSTCDPCGGSCWGGCATGNCASGDCGISTPAYSADPASSSGAATSPSPSTYAPKSIPEDNMADPGGGFVLPSESDEGIPPNPGESEFERGIDFNSNKIPADAEPEAVESLKVEEEAAQPLRIEGQLVFRLQPERSRVHYRAIFRAPHVARADVPARSPWTPIKADAQLASSN